MANSFSSITGSAMGILKNFYAGPIVSEFNDDIPFYKQAEKGKEKWNGVQVNRPLKVRRNQGIGATTDGGLLPAIGQQTVIQAVINAKFNYLRFGITGPMIKASQGDKGAFVSAVEYEMQQGLNDLKQDINRQLFWDGTGTLATVAANVAASNVVTATGRESTENGTKYLEVGMVIDIYTSAGVAVATGVAITALTGSTTATITLSAAVTCSATDIIVRSGAYGNEIQGILTTLDGGTSSIYSVNRATYPVFQGNSVSLSGAQLNLNAMEQTLNEGRRRGGSKFDVLYSDYDSERWYNKLLVADKRYIGKVAGDGTFSNESGTYLEYAGTKLVPDKDCPNRFFFLDSKTWKKYVLSELEWADETGSYMLAQVSTDAFEARLRLFANLFCEKPSANAVLKSYISP